MKKLLIPLSLILLLLITACGSTTPKATDQPAPTEAVAQATEASEAAPTKAAEAAPTQQSATTAATGSSDGASDSTAPALSADGEVGCRAESIDSLIILPLASIAPASDVDWQKKGNQAPVTLIEYGDYQ